MAPGALVLWTTMGLAIASAVQHPGKIGLFLMVVLAYACLRQRTIRPIMNTLVWSLPFVVPLFIMHAIANHAFPQSHTIVGLPIRILGAEYAMLVALRVSLMVALGAWWREMDAERVVRSAIRWRLPLPLVVMATMACAAVVAIVRRIATVFEAQQARGIRVRGGIFVRAQALVPVVIPVIVGSIIEADARALALTTRGLGSGPIAVPPASPITTHDILDVVVCLASSGASLLVSL